MIRWLTSLALALCMMAITGCDHGLPAAAPGSAARRSPSAGEPGSATTVPVFTGTVAVSGSSTIAPLAAELGKRFEGVHPDARINVETGGSSRGIADARSGQVDIGMVSRALKPDEHDLTAHLIARDGVAMIVNAGVEVNELSREQIIAIYTGTITNWKELNGVDQEITVVNKAEGRSTLELFLHHFGLKAPQIRASVVIGDNQQGIKSVASIPGAIGYVSIGSAEAAVAEGTGVRLLPLEGVQASTANVLNGTFPLSRELNLVTKGAPSSTAQAFIEFCRSREADSTIRELFFVPLH